LAPNDAIDSKQRKDSLKAQKAQKQALDFNPRDQLESPLFDYKFVNLNEKKEKEVEGSSGKSGSKSKADCDFREEKEEKQGVQEGSRILG
jgi:hypothetical protein